MAKKLTVLQLSGQLPDLSPIQHAFQLLKTTLKVEAQQQAAAEGGRSKNLKGRNSYLVRSMGYNHQVFIDCKRF